MSAKEIKNQKEEAKQPKILTAEERRMCEEIKPFDVPEEINNKKELHPEEKRQTTGEQLIERYKNGKFDEKLFRKIHELSKDPNKMNKNGYRRLIKAIASGSIPTDGKFGYKFVSRLLAILESEDDPKKDYVEKLLTQLADGKVISKITAKDILAKDLAVEAQSNEEIDEEEERQSTGAKILNLVQKADTQKQVEDSTQVKEENWAIERPPKEVTERLKEALQKTKTLIDEEQSLNEKLQHESRAKVPNLQEISRIKARIASIDEEIDTIREESKEANKEYTDYLSRNLSRFRALRYFSERAGLDMNRVSKLTTWFFNINQNPSTALEGIEIDQKTGQTTKSRKVMQINRIYFTHEKSDSTAQAPGELMVEYTYLEGEKPVTTETNYKNFIGLMDTYDGYEEVDSTEKFNELFGYELGYKDVQKLNGETFSATIVEDLDEKGTPRHKNESFTVEKVHQKGGKWYVKLDKSVTVTRRQTLPNSIHPMLYFDRKQREFELGAFGTFLRKNGYQRNVADDEMQEIVDKSLLAQKNECIGFISDATPQEKEIYEGIGGIPYEKLSLPEKGLTQYVDYLDEFGRKKRAKLIPTKNEKGETEYEVEYTASGTDGIWGMPSLPAEPQFDLPSTSAIMPIPGVPNPRVTKRRLSKRDLLQAVNKGQIHSAPTENDEGSKAKSQLEEALHNAEQHEEQAHEQEHHSPEAQAEAGPKKPSSKKKYYEEALPYEAVHKVGGMQTTEHGFLKSLWIRTTWLSIDDVWQMGKVMYEYYIRRFERRQKEKYSKVSQELPFFAPEMRRINQATANEQIGQFKEAFETKGVGEITERLVKTSNRDEMKAALNVLCSKGQLRWDNIDFWKNINKFVQNPRKAIPIPSNGDPYTQISDKDPRVGFDFLEEAMDSIWGEGHYSHWYSENKSAYASHSKGYYEEGKQLEGVDAGHEGRLAALLLQHKEGGHVEAHEYEGLILHSIEAGKSDMQSKIYYMVQGVACQNKHGHTILSFDRIAHINSEMLARFPILEYICGRALRSNGKRHRFALDDYKRWAEWFDMGNPHNCSATPAVDEFMWKYVIPSDETQNRINKALRHGENLDHDDMFAYLPPATEQIITDACKATTGSKKFFTVEGYANAIPGFSQYIKSLSNNNNRERLVEAVKSYVRFSGIMTNRFEKAKTSAQDSYQRLDDYTMNSATIVSKTPPKSYMMVMDSAIQRVVAAYNDTELNDIANIVFNEPTVTDLTIPSEQQRQNRINIAYTKFGKIFHRVIQRDGGERMTNILASAGLEGLPFMSGAEKAKRKAALKDQAAAYTNELALDY